MKIVALAILALTFGFACGKAEVKPNKPATTPAPSTPAASTPDGSKNGNYNGKGRVTKIDTQIGSVELNHEDIPGLMPAMIMEFYVKDPAQLSKIKVGDRVDFVIEYKDGTEKIATIEKSK